MRRLPRQSWPVLLLGLYALIVSLVGNLSVLAHLNEPSIGVLTFWSPVRQCFVVNGATPQTWPALAEGILQPGDCIETVGNLNAGDDAAVSAHLGQVVSRAGWFERHTSLTGRRDQFPFQAEVPVIRLTTARMLQHLLPFVITGAACWFLGLLVLLARPDTSSNQVLAALLFLGSLLVVGANEGFEYPVAEPLYVAAAIVGPRPFFGALLFHLAFIFPESPRNRRLLWLRLALYPLAAVAALLAVIEVSFNRSGQPWLAGVTLTGNLLTAAIFVAGWAAFTVRSVLAWRHPSSPRVAQQARLLALAVLLVVPLALVVVVISNLGLPWPLPFTSNVTFVFWLIPAAALVAYAMLRYQAFDYRGQALNALLILLTSASLTQVYAVLLAPRGWDGVQFTLVWGAMLLATLFWYLDTPVRRGFRRLFARHEYDYQIADRFSSQMAQTTSVQNALAVAAHELCRGLETRWAAIMYDSSPHHMWLATADQPQVTHLQPAMGSPQSLLPDSPALVLPLRTGSRQTGVLWLGPRTTAEPLDRQDGRLAGLLGQSLSRTLAVHAQIEELEQVPGRVLAAVETDRQRIAQDLHDSVLQFLGAISLDLDRAASLVVQNPPAAREILERYAGQAETIAHEARGLVYDLAPPAVAQGGWLTQARAYAEQACAACGVSLVWQVTGEVEIPLGEGEAIHLYRIFQQAITNALDHAQASTITVRVARDAQHIRLEVQDDGAGFDLVEASGQPHHLGLLSMRERARALGGAFAVDTEPGRGATVRVAVPCWRDGDTSQ